MFAFSQPDNVSSVLYKKGLNKSLLISQPYVQEVQNSDGKKPFIPGRNQQFLQACFVLDWTRANSLFGLAS